MVKYFSVILLFVALVSCKKNNNIIDQPDRILYTDIDDTTLSSIDSMIYIGEDDYGPCYQPVPTESEKSMEIDFDKDGINDFVVTHSHWYGTEMWSPHCWCDVYKNFKTEIEGYNSNQILVKYTSCLQFPESINLSDTIDSTARYTEPPHPGWQWHNKASIYLYSADAMCSGYPESEYIGVRLSKNDSILYGWLRIFADQNTFTVKEFAVNLTSGNCILAGQTE